MRYFFFPIVNCSYTIRILVRFYTAKKWYDTKIYQLYSLDSFQIKKFKE